MNILMIYPEYPDTYWSFSHALRFISKKVAVPPLGLLTISAMLPKNWNKKLIDMNMDKLKTVDLLWADYVFISAMHIQKESVDIVVKRCLAHQKKMVAGGPLFTQDYQNYPMIDHFVLNEAEITLPLFLKALENHEKLDKVYETKEFADLTQTPVPDYHLLSMKKYASMNLQVSRGCPYSCDFCEITTLLGHKVRMKDTQQIINELQALYDLNWRGAVSVVDDNFIGNRKQIKSELLPAMHNWMQAHKYPFVFNAQTSINIADDDILIKMMRDVGFKSIFIGIETVVEESLAECDKVQNRDRDLLQSVKKIQHNGMQVSGGFIVGFDNDQTNVFQRQIDFIQQSGIVAAMVGLLNAPKNTKLYERMKEENRLMLESSGNNTDFSMNFTPKMNKGDLLEGYNNIIKNIYSIKPFYKRIRQFLINFNATDMPSKRPEFSYILAFFKTIIIIGIYHRGWREYWKLLFWTLRKRPKLFMEAITFIVYGYHFRMVYGISR